ncbi:MAG: hypothetical protein WC509_04660 [Candidatus Izemoplasmatales bacterium]
MKKAIMLLLGLVFCAAMIACETTTTAPSTTASTTAAVTTATTAPTTTTTVPSTTTVADAVVEGNYYGSHTVSAMGSEVVYHYVLIFADGAYAFRSVFEMGEEAYSFEETGTYSVAGDVLTMTPEGGSAATGTVAPDGSISAPVKASEMGSRALRTLAPTELEFDLYYVGSHEVSAMGTPVVYHYYIVLSLDGTYSFHSAFVMSEETYTYDEVGTYAATGLAITLTPDGGDAAEGTIGEDGTLSLPLKASSMGSRALRTVAVTALSYDTAYAGTHTVSAMGSEVVYEYTITFDVLGNYAFHSDFMMGEEPYTFDEVGTFTVEGLVITITPEGGTALPGTIHADGSLTLNVKASSMGSRADRTLAIPEPVVVE